MSDNPLSPGPGPLGVARDSTPARVLVGRAGPGYRTRTWLSLREDHAAARDAVQAEVDLLGAFGHHRIATHQLFAVTSRAGSKAEYLRRPDLGRRLEDESRRTILDRCPAVRDVQVVIGDGLSATAVSAQAPAMLDGLRTACEARGWSFGRPFLVRYCRVGVMNDVGDLLNPAVVVLLIGERPGLATAESLSAYLAFRPRAGHTDADRNLISNIHSRGVPCDEAVCRVVALADQFRAAGRSGVSVKELAAAPPPLPT
ncbi:ethanolamine ammonia-lyase : Ethanolamine ammonia-lyase light chain (Ethanolamine ammonia-lyase small subunit) OS=Frankia alni (strain ACN14a) GN=eutC PE=4 SV=1: EutC [Gemmataceae bacterium]|nr:ethanolamine ammonia-lyase : Ethanolamine ammonia-lyase light chain (Ethanolamine ammonia-lyase small subunit) OS=Frankia alni (strain ACN14a) GN=eutC PE=4 SV=1: EutC [Gemmataceae bacterium]VTT98682.1 ethanolamine ammonia-lyase : Ethanolamine ammonia-lyase light chain (Ethanolamine ammonia-lyase small subunit) OS=Frankia alni (strain ACN14a) GN=eutC PE=4 SV=1: EutC [Gemmataceae bacterium]